MNSESKSKPDQLRSSGSSTPTQAEEPLWTVNDLARQLTMSVSWVRQAEAAGRIPSIRLGAAIRFVPAAVREWLGGDRGGRALRVVLPGCRGGPL